MQDKGDKMDFSKVKEISIKEGNVKQVAVNGTILWEKDNQSNSETASN